MGEAKRRAQIEAKLENDKIQERKSEIKRIENEADIKIIQESIARSLLEEQRRSEELKNRLNSSYKNVKTFESQPEGKMNDSKKKEERRLIHEVEKKIQMDEEREKQRGEIRRKEAMKSLHVNLQLME